MPKLTCARPICNRSRAVYNAHEAHCMNVYEWHHEAQRVLNVAVDLGTTE